jgi:hypothetical protein
MTIALQHCALFFNSMNRLFHNGKIRTVDISIGVRSDGMSRKAVGR